MALPLLSRGPRCDALSPAPPRTAGSHAQSSKPLSTHTHRLTLLNRPHPHVSQTNLLHQPVHGFELARGCAYRCAAPRLASSRLRHAAPGLAPGLKPGLAPGLAPEHGAVLGPQTRSRTRVPCRVVVTTHLPMPRRTTSRRTSSTYACSSATVASASRPCRWGRLRVG